jgi:electron transfer flavoprotein beta subunit
LKIAVCIKQTPASGQVDMDMETGVLLRANARAVLNPYDRYAVETALRLREKLGGSVTALSMGPAAAKAVIEEALSVGADGGYLLCDPAFAGSDVYATAYVLSRAVGTLGGFDLVICGRQTTDGDTAQVGPALAAHLRWPFIGWVNAVAKAEPEALTVCHAVTDGTATSRVPVPCVIAVDRDIYPPRLPTARQKLMARRTPVPVLTLSDLKDCDASRCGLEGSPTRVRQLFFPERTPSVPPIHGSAQELAQRLHTLLIDEKVIGEER